MYICNLYSTFYILFNMTKNRKTTLLLIVLIFSMNSLYSQNKIDSENLILWSSSKKLTIDDFGIKKDDSNIMLSFGQFSIDYQIGGFSFMSKNFNKKVRNYMIKSASWINTKKNVLSSLLYQQTLFDLSEVYTRQFRKALKENKKKFISGNQLIEQLNQEVLTEFSNRRIIYDEETNYAINTEKQKEWEIQIQKELEELKEYAYEK